MIKLSVVIITYNEERNIGRCLDSVKKIADEIVVVDSFSSDQTPQICKEYGINFVQQKWEGYSATKNFANSLAKHDWIFSIDADEAVSENLQQSIIEIKNKITCPTPFKINRLVNYCGKWVRHGGWYPDIKVRFFDRRKSKWQGVIHETLSNIDEIFCPLLQGNCYHYSYYSIKEHIAQAQHFTDIAAKDLFEKKYKISFLQLFLSPAAKFIRDYFLRAGFLDGYIGFTIAWISTKASYWKYYKLKKLRLQNANS